MMEGFEAILARRWEQAAAPFIIGVTGGVAAGKSTLSADLAARMRLWPPGLAVEIVGTDGFLRDNATLEAEGLSLRKGYPETYDIAALAAALRAIRRGPADFPGYSHRLYDVDPALTRTLERPDILIVEGLGLAGAPVDVLIYIDASPEDLETWYIARFMALWEAGRADAASFYARFAAMTPDQAEVFGRQVWRTINLPNVLQHVMPLRERADIVVRKSSDHGIEGVIEHR
jgi:type I pantothenate kinase